MMCQFANWLVQNLCKADGLLHAYLVFIIVTKFLKINFNAMFETIGVYLFVIWFKVMADDLNADSGQLWKLMPYQYFSTMGKYWDWFSEIWLEQLS